MKTFTTILFAGAMFAGLSFGQINDNGANARFHMKTGRDLPGVTAQAPAHCCSMTVCQMAEAKTTVAPSDAEQRFHAKYGRYTPAEEARLQTSAPAAIASAMPASTDAADRLHAKTGRFLNAGAVQIAAASTSDCAMMSCCKRQS
jgi:hypothetical protein